MGAAPSLEHSIPVHLPSNLTIGLIRVHQGKPNKVPGHQRGNNKKNRKSTPLEQNTNTKPQPPEQQQPHTKRWGKTPRVKLRFIPPGKTVPDFHRTPRSMDKVWLLLLPFPSSPQFGQDRSIARSPFPFPLFQRFMQSQIGESMPCFSLRLPAERRTVGEPEPGLRALGIRSRNRTSYELELDRTRTPRFCFVARLQDPLGRNRFRAWVG
ncbi:hypothetical protein BP00DRAFT_35829 [Aspergillus indologenus CBS 114.80]|uniref:Uncharacterized protein n=1 Tax=Aspergillus indologenus CBS 114.80 TaxID=1450541 RepID=A0A2V5IEV9_9EURO|nr:hypothetical protein BP00DRAFT_35829 [Aspergillus indologenus CBS 114.80]